MAAPVTNSQLCLLPASSVRLIGSGQVITSVFSVVKELFENSVDALSSHLDIRLDDFGLDRVEVCDNGKGVRKEDVPFLAKRHFTSKFSRLEDFLTLDTYGFRGEALASLCSVAELTVTTKTEDDDVSMVYKFDSEGSVISSKPSHHGKGTTVSVRHLFQNLPVRRQCYKTSQKRKDELRRIEDLLIVFSITKPNLRIRLKHGNDVIFQKLPMPDSKSVLHSVLGRQVANQLIHKEQTLTDLQGSVSCFIPKPGSDIKILSRSNCDRTFVVVNDRPVHVKEIVRVLKLYYMNCHGCDSARYPLCYVSIKLPTPDVDVNMEPNKTTVLLRPMTEVCKSLEEILLQVYGPLDSVPPWHYCDSAENNTQEKIVHSSKSCSKVPKAKPVGIEWNLPDAQPQSGDDDLLGSKQQSVNSKECGRSEELHQNRNVIIEDKEKTACGSDSRSNDLEMLSDIDDMVLLDHILKEELPTENNNNIDVSAPTAGEMPGCGPIEMLPQTAIHTAHSVDKNSSSSAPQSDTLDWAKGHMLESPGGILIQPVQLLAPSSKHTPGKRPLSPASEEMHRPPLKQRSSLSTSKELSTNQSTLEYMISSKSSPSVNVCSKQTSFATGQLLQSGESSLPKGNPTKSKVNMKIPQASVRDQVASLASQSQAEQPRKSRKNRLYHAERNVPCHMGVLKTAIRTQCNSTERLFFKQPIVVGHSDQCEAWLCCYKSSLGILNTHRLRESILYKKLLSKHRLPVTPLDEPIRLDNRNLNQAQLSTLEKLAKQCDMKEPFDIKDNRLVANGFDVKCYFDGERFISELFGLCNLIPTYDIRDLGEMLDILSSNSSCTVAESRPTKTQFYLQNEAARMTLQNPSLKAAQQVTDLLSQFSSAKLESELCIHHKPLFHVLFNLEELGHEMKLGHDL